MTQAHHPLEYHPDCGWYISLPDSSRLEPVPCSPSAASPAASGTGSGEPTMPHQPPSNPPPGVPEWCFEGVRQCGTGVQLRGTSPVPYHLGADALAFAMTQDINSGLAALRDHYEGQIRDLTERCDKQMGEIDRLQIQRASPNSR